MTDTKVKAINDGLRLAELIALLHEQTEFGPCIIDHRTLAEIAGLLDQLREIKQRAHRINANAMEYHPLLGELLKLIL